MEKQRLIFSLEVDEKYNLINTNPTWELENKLSKLFTEENPKSIKKLFISKFEEKVPHLSILSIKMNGDNSAWVILSTTHEFGKSYINIFSTNSPLLELKNLYRDIKNKEVNDLTLNESEIDLLAKEKNLLSLYLTILESIKMEFGPQDKNIKAQTMRYNSLVSLLKECFNNMYRLISKQDDLIIGAAKITSLSETFNIISLNTSVKSLRLQTRTIGTVAVHLQESSQNVIQNVKGLQNSVTSLLDQLKDLTLSITTAILSNEVIIADLNSKNEPSESGIKILKSSLRNAITDSDRLKKSLREADPFVDSIQKNLLSLQHIQNIGLMESAVSSQNDTFEVTFLDIRGCLDKVETEFSLVKENVLEMTLATNSLSNKLYDANF